MFQLDDTFLEEVGLGTLPEAQRKPFLQYVYNQLEKQVGFRLSEGMTDEQLQEFEAIIDHKEEVVVAWLAQHAPEYQNEEIFKRLVQASGLSPTDPNLRDEFAATKWLEVNRPDYRQVVAQTLDEIKKEITANKDAILEGGAPQA
jgi:hypothetical protein